MIQHILLIKYKSNVKAEEINKVRKVFESIPDKIESVLTVERGINSSPENLNQGYTHSVFMTLPNEVGRNKYLPHPEHKSLIFFQTATRRHYCFRLPSQIYRQLKHSRTSSITKNSIQGVYENFREKLVYTGNIINF